MLETGEGREKERKAEEDSTVTNFLNLKKKKILGTARER